MKKSVGIYSIVWAICLAVFNVIVFVTPNEIGGISKFSSTFWISYAFITVAFVGQLICALFALSAKNSKKLFYNIPLISVSYGGLIAMLIVGGIFMAIPILPDWIAVIACVIILAFNAIAIIKAASAANIVSGIDEKVKLKTILIKSLTADAQSLMSSAATEELRAEVKRVYEALRYSDPMTCDALSDIDSRVCSSFNAFSAYVRIEDVELARSNADALIEAIQCRNSRCKLLK